MDSVCSPEFLSAVTPADDTSDAACTEPPLLEHEVVNNPTPPPEQPPLPLLPPLPTPPALVVEEDPSLSTGAQGLSANGADAMPWLWQVVAGATGALLLFCVCGYFCFCRRKSGGGSDGSGSLRRRNSAVDPMAGALASHRSGKSSKLARGNTCGSLQAGSASVGPVRGSYNQRGLYKMGDLSGGGGSLGGGKSGKSPGGALHDWSSGQPPPKSGRRFSRLSMGARSKMSVLPVEPGMSSHKLPGMTTHQFPAGSTKQGSSVGQVFSAELGGEGSGPSSVGMYTSGVVPQRTVDSGLGSYGAGARSQKAPSARPRSDSALKFLTGPRSERPAATRVAIRRDSRATRPAADAAPRDAAIGRGNFSRAATNGGGRSSPRSARSTKAPMEYQNDPVRPAANPAALQRQKTGKASKEAAALSARSGKGVTDKLDTGNQLCSARL